MEMHPREGEKKSNKIIHVGPKNTVKCATRKNYINIERIKQGPKKRQVTEN